MKTLLIPSFSRSGVVFALPYSDEIIGKLKAVADDTSKALSKVTRNAAAVSHLTWHAPFHVVLVKPAEVAAPIFAPSRVQVLDSDFDAVFAPLMHGDNDGSALLGVSLGKVPMYTLTVHHDGETLQSVLFSLPG